MKKRILSLILAFVLVLGTLPSSALAVSADAWDGTTLTEPQQVDGIYQIGTGAELAWFAQTADAASKAVLTADIDLNGQTWTAMAKLSGSFDGQGHTIKNLNGSQGLFNTVYGASNTARAEVKNVTVEGTVSGGMKIAGIAGNAYWANFTNVINRANVTGTQYVAGIVGYSLQGANGSYITLTNCGNEGTISGSINNVAGLVGYGKGAMVLEDCYNTGAITGSCNSYSSGGVGGLVGYCQGYKDASSLTNCYNTGSVDGKSGYAGGIVGTMYNGVTATNCYNTGTVTGGSGKIGAITGYAYNASSSKAVNCYYLEDSCTAAATGKPAAVDAGTTAKTDAEMKSVEFVDLLGEAYKKGETYPVLSWETVDIQTSTYAVITPEGEGFTFEGAAEATDTELYKFSVTIKDFYEATNTFAVKIDGQAQEPASVEGHVYNFEYTATADFAITVEGISYTGVKLSQAEATLYPAETLTLIAEIDPNAEGTVVWASDNEAVATVADGVVTTLKAGSANISATIGNVSAICRVTVDHRPTTVNTNDGAWGSGQIKITSVTLYDVTVKEHYWKGNTCIVVLDEETPMDAAVRFSSSGSANLLINGTLLNSAQNTASLEDGYAKLILTAEGTGVSVDRTMIIWVDGTYEYVPVTGIEIPAGSYENGNYRVQASSAIQMHAKVLPENATIQDVTWSTNAGSTNITVTESGYVQGSTMGHGTYYTLTAASAEDPTIKTTCKIYLDWKPEDSITISKNTMTLQVSETGNLSATVSGENFVTNTTVTWTSSNESIATVANGKVTGLKNGTAIITATSYYGLTATCEVTVEGGSDECDHIGTTTTPVYAQVERTETHTVTVLCQCGEQIGEVTTENCVDANKNQECDKCAGAVTASVAVTKLTWWFKNEKVTEINVEVGDVVDAVSGCTPRNTAGNVVTYTSADPEIVSVNTQEAVADAYGHAYMSFTALKAGETTITASANEATITATLKVRVVDPKAPAQIDGVYQIATADNLLWFANAVNGGDTGISAVLTADIDLTGKEWAGIGTGSYPFAGSFDGKNKTITFDNAAQGLFGEVLGTAEKRAEIKNVITVGTINTNTAGVAAIAGRAQLANISGCVNYASVKNTANYTGGIMGHVTYTSGAVTVSNCVNAGEIWSNFARSGGIVGNAETGAQSVGAVIIVNCCNTATVTAQNWAGGIIGYVSNGNTAEASQISSCYNTGNVVTIPNDNRGQYAAGNAYGGITGVIDRNVTVENCYNTGAAGFGLFGNVNSGGEGICARNCYYLDSAASSAYTNTPATVVNCGAKTAAEMSSAEFAALLGNAYQASCPAPVFTWQTAADHQMVDGSCENCGFKEEAEVKKGDVDDDDMITAKDATAILVAIAAKNTESLDMDLADMDGDNVITAKDATEILKIVAAGNSVE